MVGFQRAPIESNSELWQRNRIGGGGNKLAYVKSPEATCDIVGKSIRAYLMLIKNFCQDINHCMIHIPDELLAAHCNLETLPLL